MPPDQFKHSKELNEKCKYESKHLVMFASKLIEYFSEIKLFYLFVDFHQVTYYKEESSLLSSLLKCLNAGSNVKRIIAVSSGIMQLKESPLPGYLRDMIYNFLFYKC